MGHALVCNRNVVLTLAVLLLTARLASADYAAGLTAFNQKDFPRAFSEWIESAKSGDSHAQHGVGLLYELGQGVPYEDPKTAAEWYEKAAAQNYAPAINNLARLYADGRGVTQDIKKAIELWSRAADAGNATARFNLGLQYANGGGVDKDQKKAAAYLLQAAESGLPEAQFAIADRFRDGMGVEKDVNAARLWYDRAATGGLEPAREALAALDQSAPAVSAVPAVDNASAPPAEAASQPATQTANTETPAPDTAAASESGTKAPEAPVTPAETSGDAPASSATTDTAQPQTPEAAQSPESTSQAPTEPTAEAAVAPPPGETPAETPTQDATENTGENEQPPAEEDAPAEAATAPASDLPLAESLTGDARIYRIWLYESAQEGDAASYWEKLNAQYPALLKPLQLDLRRYVRGLELGSAYRVFAGPFEDLGAAQKACADIKARFSDQFCRPVLN